MEAKREAKKPKEAKEGGTMKRGLDQGEEECQKIPAFSILRNSALAEASFSGSKQRALVKTGGPCLGVEAKKPWEERKSGYSNRSFRISLGARCRCAQNGSEAAGEEMAERTSREYASKTLALGTS